MSVGSLKSLPLETRAVEYVGGSDPIFATDICPSRAGPAHFLNHSPAKPVIAFQYESIDLITNINRMLINTKTNAFLHRATRYH